MQKSLGVDPSLRQPSFQLATLIQDDSKKHLRSSRAVSELNDSELNVSEGSPRGDGSLPPHCVDARTRDSCRTCIHAMSPPYKLREAPLRGDVHIVRGPGAA